MIFNREKNTQCFIKYSDGRFSHFIRYGLFNKNDIGIKSRDLLIDG